MKREEVFIYAGLLGKAQTKLSLISGRKERAWGRQGEPGLLLLLLSGG